MTETDVFAGMPEYVESVYWGACELCELDFGSYGVVYPDGLCEYCYETELDLTDGDYWRMVRDAR